MGTLRTPCPSVGLVTGELFCPATRQATVVKINREQFGSHEDFDLASSPKRWPPISSPALLSVGSENSYYRCHCFPGVLCHKSDRLPAVRDSLQSLVTAQSAALAVLFRTAQRRN